MHTQSKTYLMNIIIPVFYLLIFLNNRTLILIFKVLIILSLTLYDHVICLSLSVFYSPKRDLGKFNRNFSVFAHLKRNIVDFNCQREKDIKEIINLF